MIWRDDDGTELEIGRSGKCAEMIVRKGVYDESVTLDPQHVPGVARALYEACGLPAPVILPRPEPHDYTHACGLSIRREGSRIFAAIPGREVSLEPPMARELAAYLAAWADDADAEPDPAEVDALAAAIMAELNPGAMGLDGARPYARAALRWMREREARDDRN